MAKIVDSKIRALMTGKKLSERVAPMGSLFVVKRANGEREFYYRRRHKNRDQSIKLGNYNQDAVEGKKLLSLAQARSLAAEIADQYSDVSDLKQAIEQDKAAQQATKQKALDELNRKNNLGSLNDLFEAYTERMRVNGKISWLQVRKQLSRHVSIPFPELGQRPAHQITTKDINQILRPMMEKEITTTINRVRGDLHAAFNFGMKHDDTPWETSTKGIFFEIESNPVSRIAPNREWEKQGDRVLTEKELFIIWRYSIPVMGRVYGSMLRIMICTGLRPTDLILLKPSAICLKNASAYITDTKNKIPNLIPLNKYACQELQFLLEICNDDGLFPTATSISKSDARNRVSVLANYVHKLRQHLQDLDEPVEHFTARDFRRTVKTLMGKAGISKDIRDRLQNHAQSDVSSKHYDRYDYWPEKVEASKKWEKWMTDNLF